MAPAIILESGTAFQGCGSLVPRHPTCGSNGRAFGPPVNLNVRLAMSAKELESIFLIAVVVLMAYLGFRSSNMNNQIKADKLKKREEEIQEELAFIRSTRKHFPDREAVVSALLERYTWQQVFEGFGIGVLEMELLRSLRSCSSISLPNPNAVDLNNEERQVLRDAKKAADTFGEDRDLESCYQEPTVRTLRDLALAGLVDSQATGDTEGREFKVSITLRGRQLLKLDKKFRSTDSRFEIPSRLFQTTDARSEFASVVRVVLGVGEPNPSFKRTVTAPLKSNG
ncbi:hypothetical protein [Serpentinimonas barnesii]|uniref:hypothetical protein n=1 Tax=Serpentinimonas barnesii TaxID=1458427 RepID=UPI0011EA6BA8|nr:hypothetical protein [Serpentinimonas barnesii]